MWVFSTLGFYSIVKKDDGWQVRARERRDLENLCREVCIKQELIITTPNADYRYRIVVDRQALDAVFGVIERTVTYPNFKGEIHKTPDQVHKSEAYGAIWFEMVNVQEFEKYLKPH